MPTPRRLILLLAVPAVVLAVWLVHHWRAPAPQAVVKPQASYAQTLSRARNGDPGAARLLYQQLQQPSLSTDERVRLLKQLPHYPSPQAMKLAGADLRNDESKVRSAAIDCISGLVSGAQRSVLLGPLLDDSDPDVRDDAIEALLPLPIDDLGLYYGPMEDAIAHSIDALASQTDNAHAQVSLARLYLHENDLQQAQGALDAALAAEPGKQSALALRVQVLDKQGQPDAARQVLADALKANPQSAYLQAQLGLWLQDHGQEELALLALSRSVELAPNDADLRYNLAVALHRIDQVDAAQRQLEDLVRRQPANRQARLTLIQYWTETGQLQNVQVLLAELEQQNPDDPALQQGL